MKYWLECLGLAALITLINSYPLPLPLPIFKQLIIPMVIFGLSLILGLRFPDVDLYTPGLKHRSAVTHSALLPWLVTLLGNPAILAGLSIGMAIHIFADIFPKAWIGGALVKMPLFGSLGKLSPYWLTLNCLVCLAIGMQSVSINGDSVKYGSLCLSLIILLWYLIKKEKSMPPLLSAFMIIGVLCWYHYLPDLSSFSLDTLTAGAGKSLRSAG
ncbi:MAG: hypothetical protein QS721_04550 [Candidatus Endonucleobacter sp. (ex Gigantidas childressi)]|nr:hypothetical protein [Candidatus Endonucleobacter sp. (ex Gigantidas childressi)]